MSYSAIITKIQTKPHPNADRLLLGNCLGFQVVCGIDTLDGALGIFFPPDGQLSDAYCKANDLYPNFDTDGNRTGGFIDPKNRRVRAQKFRGQVSEGLWMPMKSLQYLCSSSDDYIKLAYKELSIGLQFTELRNSPICNKYISPATLNKQNSNKQGKGKKNRKETPWLKMHPDTPHMRYNYRSLKDGDTITITEKLHGTSQRTGWDWHTEKVPHWKWLQPLMRFEFLHPYISHEVSSYRILNGTRQVLMEDFNEESRGFYKSNEFRAKHADFVASVLPEGYQLYYEVVGWVNENTPIMHSPATSKVDKELTKQYGDVMEFNYGCKRGDSAMFAYALTYTSPNGKRIEFPYSEMSRLCNIWGIPVVPMLCNFDYVTSDEVEELVTALEYGTSILDTSHIREGVVIEVESKDGKVARYKHKNKIFYILEDVIKGDDSIVDIEEAEE